MSDFNKSVLWTSIAIVFVGIILVVIVVTSNRLLPPTIAAGSQPLAKQAEVAPAQPTPASFVVLPGKFVGGFVLGMSKKDVLKIASKPQQNSADRLVYKSQKTGNRLTARFQKNRLVQIDFTSKDFYTEEGIHPGNFRDAQYATLFNVQEVAGSPSQLKYSLKTGGLIFYGNTDALSGAIGVVHEGREPIYIVKSITGNTGGQEQKRYPNISETPQAQNKLREAGNNSSYENLNDIQVAKKFVSEMPPACQGSQYSVSRDGTVTVRILCLGSSAATSINGSIEIKDGIVKNIR